MEVRFVAVEKEREQGQQGEETTRESGLPGGGKGRRDEVGRSGVYPVSEIEAAPADAVIRGQMEWGQGERGAAGFEDHGDSEEMAFWEAVERGGYSIKPAKKEKE